MMMFEAVCRAGIVSIKTTLEEIVVPDCQILGAGTAPESTGLLIADNNRFWYVPLMTPDIKTILDHLISICDDMKEITSNLKNAKTLLDNNSTVVGSATLTPSVVTGTQMATDATATETKITELKTRVETLKNQLV